MLSQCICYTSDNNPLFNSQNFLFTCIYSTCDVIITLKSWISGLSGNNWIPTGLLNRPMGVLSALAAACWMKRQLLQLERSEPDRERTNHSVFLWWNWLFCQRKFHSFTISFVDNSLSRASAHGRLSDRLKVEREEWSSYRRSVASTS
jgi:hypothetical protein